MNPAKSPRKKAKANGFADGMHGYPCNTSQYHLSWHLATEYLSGYIEGCEVRRGGVRFPQEDE